MTYDELTKSILTSQEQMLEYGIEANSVTLNGKKYGKLVENCPPNMKPTIFGMAVKADYAMPDYYEYIVQYEPPKSQTNADRIRAMTDEELAELLNLVNDGDCLYAMGKTERCGNCGGEGCPCWLEWLREEVDDAEAMYYPQVDGITPTVITIDKEADDDER